MKKLILNFLIHLISFNSLFSAAVKKVNTNITYDQNFFNTYIKDAFHDANKFISGISQFDSYNMVIPDKTQNILRVMTFNVFSYKDVTKKDSKEYLLTFIQKLQPDILILQEAKPFDIKDNSKNHPVVNELIKLGYKSIVYASMDTKNAPNDGGQQKVNVGNMIFSKLPFLQKSYSGFKTNTDKDIPNGRWRSYVRAEFDLSKFGKKNLVVYGTHLAIYTLNLKKDAAEKKNDQRIREEEIKELIDKANKEDVGKNIIIAADFNQKVGFEIQSKGGASTKTIPFMQQILNKGNFESSFNIANLNVPIFTNFHGNVIDDIQSKLIDLNPIGVYIYYSTISDHLPVIMDFALEPKKEEPKKEDIKKEEAIGNTIFGKGGYLELINKFEELSQIPTFESLSKAIDILKKISNDAQKDITKLTPLRAFLASRNLYPANQIYLEEKDKPNAAKYFNAHIDSIIQKNAQDAQQIKQNPQKYRLFVALDIPKEYQDNYLKKSIQEVKQKTEEVLKGGGKIFLEKLLHTTIISPMDVDSNNLQGLIDSIEAGMVSFNNMDKKLKFKILNLEKAELFGQNKNHIVFTYDKTSNDQLLLLFRPISVHIVNNTNLLTVPAQVAMEKKFRAHISIAFLSKATPQEIQEIENNVLQKINVPQVGFAPSTITLYQSEKGPKFTAIKSWKIIY